MKKAFTSVFLCALLVLSACTSGSVTDESLSVTETETETETYTVTETETATGTEKETETETETEAETEAETVTETETETEAETEQEPEKTPSPVIKGSAVIEPGVAMIYGECENNAVLTVRSELEEYEARSDGAYFAVAAALHGKGETVIGISAVTAGKTESDTAKTTVKNNKNADSTGVAVTLGSRVIEKKVLPDQYGTNAFSDDELKSIKDTVKYRLAKAEKNAGKPVRLVYIIVPDPLTVYNEELTEQMREKVLSPNLRMKQTVQALSGIDGVTVIDLTETMISNKENGKLYYKLDSHWTELGAFYAYQTVMKTLGLPYHTLSDYRVDYIDIDDTDMNVYSGVGTGEMYESAPFLTALFEEKTPYGANKEETARIWDYGYRFFIGQTSKTVTDEGPCALMMFDSYGFNIMPYLAESFGVCVTQPVWKYSADYSLVSEIQPDYIIELLAERNLDELLYSS